MKLKQITVKEPVERLSVSIKRSSMELLEAYRAEYAKLYEADIEMSPFVETILKNFIESDKTFMKRYAQAQAQAQQAEQVTTATSVATSSSTSPTSSHAHSNVGVNFGE